eukprot:sb/3474862/
MNRRQSIRARTSWTSIECIFAQGFPKKCNLNTICQDEGSIGIPILTEKGKNDWHIVQAPFIKGLEGIPRWGELQALLQRPGGNSRAGGGIHNQSYLQFQIRYRNRFGIIRKRKIRAFNAAGFKSLSYQEQEI